MRAIVVMAAAAACLLAGCASIDQRIRDGL